MTFAEYLRRSMEARQMNQSELARAAGISHKSVSYYLNRNAIPKHSTLVALGDALRVPRHELFEAAGRGHRHGPFRLPEARAADAETLTPEQSELIYEMIRHLAKGNRRQQGDSDEEFEVDKADRANVARRERAPHRARRAGHDPEWDDLYGDYELAAQEGIEGVDPGEVEEQYP